MSNVGGTASVSAIIPAPVAAAYPVPAPLTAVTATRDMGRLLYEIESRDGRRRVEIKSLQFYEHVVVRNVSYYEGSQLTDFIIDVIPRYKLVNASIEKRTKKGRRYEPPPIPEETTDCCKSMMNSCCCCCELSLQIPPPRPDEPDKVTFSITLVVRKDNIDTEAFLSLPQHFPAVPEKFQLTANTLGGQKVTKTVVFSCKEAPNAPFIIQYVFGILKDSNVISSAHLMNHLTATKSPILDHADIESDEEDGLPLPFHPPDVKVDWKWELNCTWCNNRTPDGNWNCTGCNFNNWAPQRKRYAMIGGVVFFLIVVIVMIASTRDIDRWRWRWRWPWRWRFRWPWR